MVDHNFVATAVVFVVTDLRTSVEWYVEHLGFNAAAVNWEENPTFCVVERDGAAIMLHQGEQAGTANRHLIPGQILFDAYIWVKDLQHLELVLNMSKTPIFAGPTKRIYGCKELMVADPDDYLICFGYCP